MAIKNGGKNGGPYTLETVLGWCVVGPIGRSCKGDDIISCNRIAVQDAGTKQISRHHFEIQNAVKDTGISDMMQRMYQLDFIEPRTKFKDLMTNRLDEISYEDKKFLKIMEDQVVKVGNHYETPLPLRHHEMTLPNNRVIAEERAHYLKRKFQKYELYFSHYKDFMNEIIEKRYARVSDRTPADGRLWYLPHHIILQNPIKSALYLTAVLSMLVYLSKKSFWLDLTLLIRSLVSSSYLGKEKLLLSQTQKRCSFKFWLAKNIGVCCAFCGGKMTTCPGS